MMLARYLSANGKSRLMWFGALMMLTAAAVTSCAVREPPAVEGTWVITSSYTPGISAMLPEQIKTWLGQSFQYNSENVILGQKQCGPLSWKSTSLSESDFHELYRVSFKQLDIVANKVQRFDVDCHGESLPGQTVLVASKERAFTVWDGVFFQMEKAEAEM